MDDVDDSQNAGDDVKYGHLTGPNEHAEHVANRPPQRKTAGQSRKRRRNVIASSPNRAEYESLLRAGWSTYALERYALHRFGERIDQTTFVRYRKKLGIEAPASPWEGVKSEERVDVLRLRNDLIQLQMARIAIDHKHEEQMGKLFGSTKGEIQVLDQLLSSMKTDLQDVGLLPKAGDKLEISAPKAEEAPRHQSLADVFGADPEKVIELARWVHTNRPTGTNGHSGNGQH